MSVQVAFSHRDNSKLRPEHREEVGGCRCFASMMAHLQHVYGAEGCIGDEVKLDGPLRISWLRRIAGTHT